MQSSGAQGTLTTGHLSNRAHCCVAVLCGIPGSGKSTVARAIQQHAASAGTVTVHSLCLDDILLGNSPTAGSNTFDPAAWQEASRMLHGRLQQCLLTVAAQGANGGDRTTGKKEHMQLQDHSTPSHQQCDRCEASGDDLQPPLLIIVDDNHHLTSMRRAVWRIARAGGAAYVQIFCSCLLDVALRRNARRAAAQRVSGAVVVRMERQMDVPQPNRSKWDASTIALDTSQDDCSNLPAYGARVLQQILAAWGAPVPMLADADEEQRVLESSRAATAASLIHSLDLHSRRAVSAVLCALPRADCPYLAKFINLRRKEMLQRARLLLHGHTCTGGGEGAGAAHSTEDVVDRLLAEFLEGLQDAQVPK